MARYGEESCVVRFEEGLDDDCRYAVDCFAILYESSAYRFVNTVGHTSHPGHRHTTCNHRLLYSGHRGNGHDLRVIAFGCRCSSGRPLGGNSRHGFDDPVTVVAHYPYYGRTDARPTVSRCF